MIEPVRYDVAVLGKDYEGQDCSMARALEVVGERWTLLIVRDAFYGVRRFNDFQAHLDIPKAVLSERLSWLAENGVLDGSPTPSHAGRHLYELTPAGRELWPALHALLVWGRRHRSPNSRVCSSTRPAAPCSTTPAVPDVRPDAGTAGHPDRAAPRRVAARDDRVALALRGPHRLLEPLEVD